MSQRSLMMTAFGWNDSGGGTTVPRLAAKELARRGWEVTVFHAAVGLTGTGIPYELREWEEDGVRLIGVHNRQHGLFDLGHPLRELDDPPITAAFAAALDRCRPDVVHFHNLHNLGAALIEEAAVRGLRSYFTTHNYWLICPRAYLLTGAMEICPGPGDGGRCAACVGSTDIHGHQRRLAEIRARAQSGLTSIMAVSDAVRAALLGVGYDPELVEVVRQAMPHEAEIWEQVGRDRVPGRHAERLRVAFLGSAYPHKGPQLLVAAAQLTEAPIDVRIIGEISDQFARQLRGLDRRGTVELSGSFAPAQIGALLSDVDAVVLPSLWWDCAPLAAAECHAARVPLVVPRLGGLPESVRDEFDGLVFNGLDADDLARQLDRLAREPGLLARLQANIEEPRKFAAYIDQLEAYYAGTHVASARDPVPAAVRWKGDHGLPASLSIINDRVTERLPFALQHVNRDGSWRDAPLAHPAAVEVHHQWPPDLTSPGSGGLAAIVPWEFGSVPRKWFDEIQANVDELWVPSEFVRNMYVNDGIEPSRVVTIPNGVDLDTFHPPATPRAGETVRFLYVGGVTWRKGPDILLEAWDRAFAGRDDVVLVIKAAGTNGAYGQLAGGLRARATGGSLPLVELISEDLDGAALAELYRSCDVFVLPYRGEGFAMPVLEAMASGLPVITTAGGPTDEFCPEEAGWRIRAVPDAMPEDKVDYLETVSTPWVLEPDRDHLVELLLQAATDRDELRRRGAAARSAAEQLSWDVVAPRYAERIDALARRRPRLAHLATEPFPLTEQVDLRVLATPAWRAHDNLDELLRQWATATTSQTSACLYLLADPASSGDGAEIEAHVVDAAQRGGVELDDCADINVLLEPFRADRDQRLQLAVDAFVPLHPACAGHLRYARASGTRVVQLAGSELIALLGASNSASSVDDR